MIWSLVPIFGTMEVTRKAMVPIFEPLSPKFWYRVSVLPGHLTAFNFAFRAFLFCGG